MLKPDLPQKVHVFSLEQITTEGAAEINHHSFCSARFFSSGFFRFP
jgi:hypothetical protein